MFPIDRLYDYIMEDNQMNFSEKNVDESKWVLKT